VHQAALGDADDPQPVVQDVQVHVVVVSGGAERARGSFPSLWVERECPTRARTPVGLRELLRNRTDNPLRYQRTDRRAT